MKLCVPRFGCLVQVWLPCSKGFRRMKLRVPRFGCGYFGEINLGGVGSGRR